MVAVSLALFIFDEIMRPSITTYASEGPRITLRYIRNGFIRIIDFSMVMACQLSSIVDLSHWASIFVCSMLAMMQRVALVHRWQLILVLPSHCLFFATHVHTIAACFAVVRRLYHIFLSSLLGTLSFTLTSHIHLIILISARWSATLFSVLTGRDVVSVSTSRSRDVVSKRLGLVSVSWKRGKVSVSISCRTENQMSRSRLGLVPQGVVYKPMCTAFCFIAKLHLHRFECKASISVSIQPLVYSCPPCFQIYRPPCRRPLETYPLCCRLVLF